MSKTVNIDRVHTHKSPLGSPVIFKTRSLNRGPEITRFENRRAATGPTQSGAFNVCLCRGRGTAWRECGSVPSVLYMVAVSRMSLSPRHTLNGLHCSCPPRDGAQVERKGQGWGDTERHRTPAPTQVAGVAGHVF